MPFDLVFRGAHIIDPSQDLNGKADLGVRAGAVAAIGSDLDTADCPDVRDARGLYLCPGLIDLHGHWYEAGLYGIDPRICLNHGVTTAVDAGTAGFANFPDFRRTAMEGAAIQLLGFVHISFLGLQAPFAEELLELRYARPLETAALIEKNRDRAVGVKIRIGSMTGNHGEAALGMAIEAAERAGAPLMVHISRGAREREILDRLRPGDILTHCFHGNGNGMLAQEGGLIAEAEEARKRGVIFDVGHGAGSFAWDTARKAFEHHFYPDTISTDLHRYSVAAPLCISLPGVMSKFLALGMSLPEVILKTTWAPAKVLGREQSMGTLRPGTPADLFLFGIEEGEFEFFDTHLKVRKGSQRIIPKLTVRAGVAYEAGSVPVRLRGLYPSDEAVLAPLREAFERGDARPRQPADLPGRGRNPS
jgi:dihydroorotase